MTETLSTAPALAEAHPHPANGRHRTVLRAVPLDVPAEDLDVVERDYDTFTDRIEAQVPHFFLRVWNEGRVDLTQLMWDDEIVFHTPLGAEPVRGRENVLEHVYAIQDAYSDLFFTIEDTVAQHDRVVLRVTHTGVHTGDYMGIPPTGRTVELPEIFVFRAVPGGQLGARVTDVWLMLNAVTLMQQMGVFPRGNPPRPLFRAIVGLQRLARGVRRHG